MKLERIIAVRTSKTVYRDGELCIKVFGDDYAKSRILAEAATHAKIEETGLDVSRLRCCGVVHWSHRARAERYLAVLYRAEAEGELLPATEEGRNFWMPIARFQAAEGMMLE